MPNTLHIYIVDDDDSVRKSLNRLLYSAGYTAEVFPSAQSFLDSVSPDTEGILVLDLRMPGMDGFQLQQKLKELHSQLKIIFITAHAKAGDREYAMAEGAHGFLFKPFDEHSLLNLIQTVTFQD